MHIESVPWHLVLNYGVLCRREMHYLYNTLALLVEQAE